MKTSLLALLGLFALSGFGTLRAADQLVDPQSDYTRAVQTYVDAANTQLKAIRTDLDASAKNAATEGDRKRFEPVYAKLDQSDELLADLRKADAADFDRIKSKFEQTRDDMLKALAAARGTS
jgi:hypothetical protein